MTLAQPLWLAVDVDYRSDYAIAAGVLFTDWHSSNPVQTLRVRINEVQPYQAGAFYRRELPCIQAVLAQLKQPLAGVIVDGFVYLGAEQTAGLGWHVWQALAEQVPVIGVAKTAFADTPAEPAVLRGDSARPLYVTAAGLALADAKKHIQQMHGTFRVPTLLKAVDQLCRMP